MRGRGGGRCQHLLLGLLPAGRRFGTLASCQLEEKPLAHQGVDDGLARCPAPCSWALGFNGGQEVERAADAAQPARVGSRQSSSRLASPLGRLFSAPQAPGPWTPAGRPSSVSVTGLAL